MAARGIVLTLLMSALPGFQMLASALIGAVGLGALSGLVALPIAEVIVGSSGDEGTSAGGRSLRAPRTNYTATPNSRSASLRLVFKSVLGFRRPITSAHGTPNLPAGNVRGR